MTGLAPFTRPIDAAPIGPEGFGANRSIPALGPPVIRVADGEWMEKRARRIAPPGTKP